MVVAQTVRQRGQGGLGRSANIAQSERGRTSNLGMPISKCLGEGGTAATASAPKRRKVSTAANRTMASGSAVAIVARLGRTPRFPIADVQGKQRC